MLLKTMVHYDVIVIGGGPAGAHAAYPLVESGLNVALIDGGITPRDSYSFDESETFEEIRHNRSDQHELFFGKDLEGLRVPKATDHVSQMMEGRFSYLSENTNEFLAVRSPNLQVYKTLAKGGLTETWGGACDVLDAEESRALGLPPDELATHYQIVIDRVGISGPLKHYASQPPARLSTHAEELILRSSKVKSIFDELRLTLRPSSLALLTKDLGKRKASSYADTDYWINDRRSLYRARYTLEDLQTKDNFYYICSHVVSTVNENNKGIEVKANDFSGKEMIYTAQYVIVAAGVLNTIRILLRSNNLYDITVPFISKPHIISSYIDLRFIGKVEDPSRHSLCQLIIESEDKTNGLMSTYSQLYVYKSLLLFKLLNFSPLTVPESLSLLSLLTPSIILADTRFPSVADEVKTCRLVRRDKKDTLVIDYQLRNEERDVVKTQMKKVKKGLRKLGLIALKHSYMPEGSSGHYAGGIPISDDSKYPVAADIHGKLKGSERVFVADASLWNALPSKPPTLTIMANADRIGSGVAKKIKS